MSKVKSWIESWRNGQGVKVCVGVLDVGLARWLLENEAYTRGHKPHFIRRYAKHLSQGEWHLTGETIVLNRRVEMVEGHNRCMAVVATGIPMEVVFVVGVTDEAVAYINSGCPRSAAVRRGAAEGKAANSVQSQLITRMMQTDRMILQDLPSYHQHERVSDISISALNDFHERYADGIEFAIEHLTRKKDRLSNASIMAAVAKAYYHTRNFAGGRERLVEFCEILRTSKPRTEADYAAVDLRRSLIEKTKNADNHRGAVVYLKAAYCLDAFMRGVGVKKVIPTRVDPFPLPQAAEEFDVFDSEGVEEQVNRAIAEVAVTPPA
jgi:hypothetical protein